MTYHIYNGERIVDKIYYEFNIIKGKHRIEGIKAQIRGLRHSIEKLEKEEQIQIKEA
jgi:hypothetical protein